MLPIDWFIVVASKWRPLAIRQIFQQDDGKTDIYLLILEENMHFTKKKYHSNTDPRMCTLFENKHRFTTPSRMEFSLFSNYKWIDMEFDWFRIFTVNYCSHHTLSADKIVGICRFFRLLFNWNMLIPRLIWKKSKTVFWLWRSLAVRWRLRNAHKIHTTCDSSAHVTNEHAVY